MGYIWAIAEQVAEKAAENEVIRSVVSSFERLSDQVKNGLSDEALKARVEAAAHSACKFFGIPDAELIEGDAIGVYRNCDIFLDKDVFEFNLEQFKDMQCVSFEDMTKVWAHECGHRILRMDFRSAWAQELGADFFSGVRSEMLGLPTSNFEKMLGSTTGSESHPVGSLRVQAVQFGRDVVRGFQEKGIMPTIENCKEAFAKSPFAKITYENYEAPQYSAFVDDKGNFKLKLKIDDDGNTYSQNGELVPNNEYKLNGYSYKTDDKGRIIRGEANVTINDEPRVSLNNQNVEGMQTGDDKGHLIAHVLGGADKEGNLVAMDSKLNRGEYKSMELAARNALEEGKNVNMTIDVEYEGSSKRPKSFTVTLEIDDDITVKKFANKE
jgi:hypothetical protein